MALYTPEFFASQQVESLQSAQEVVPILCDMIHPASVVDIGCGVGTWLSVFKGQGISEIQGVDGTYVNTAQLHIPRENFLPHDLTQPLPLARRFDLAMSLEVAEHLPEACAESFIQTLTRLAPVVLFSAAIPMQDGTGHVNEQWPEYWIEQFARQGYLLLDCMRPRLWENPKVAWWYAQNMFLYAHPDALQRHPALREAQAWNGKIPFHAVHPNFYFSIRHNTSPEHISLSGAWKLMRGAIRRRLLGRFLRRTA
jgi:SAM-dependent methyltransferase